MTNNNKKKFFLKTFGCQMNRHDSGRIEALLKEAGWEKVDRDTDADIILLNTCSVRRHAEDRVLGRLGKYRKWKKDNPSLLVGVIGCMAQIWKDRLWEGFPELDLILGPGRFGRLPETIRELTRGGARRIEFGFNGQNPFPSPSVPEVRGVRAMVTVSRGCNRFCSYCVVPFARGREISRSPDEIFTEVRRLVRGGCREITLLGQNVNSYRGETGEGEKIDFPRLLGFLSKIRDLERIRFITSHPADVSPQLGEEMRDLEHVCEAIHFPAQSGSDPILKKMKRGYTREEYLDKVRSLRQKMPDIGLSSDFIVGFPGETEEDFSRTLELLREVGFDQIFAFTYSPRPGTRAAQMPDDVSPEVKSKRLQRLFQLQKTLAYDKNRRLIGRLFPVLAEKRNEKYPERGEGLTRSGKRVFFPWRENLRGRTVPIKINKVTSLSLFGTEEAE